MRPMNLYLGGLVSLFGAIGIQTVLFPFLGHRTARLGSGGAWLCHDGALFTHHAVDPWWGVRQRIMWTGDASWCWCISLPAFRPSAC